jgi:hypothetical protein
MSSAPDGYAVLLDDAQSAPEGFWFVGCYTKPDIAMQVAAKNKGRMVPIYFAPSSTRALEDFIEELSAYAEKGDCDACRGAGCVGIPGAQCRYCDGSGKNRLALAFKWLALEKRVNVAEEIAQRQMNDAEAARLELAELRSRTLSATVPTKQGGCMYPSGCDDEQKCNDLGRCHYKSSFIRKGGCA